MSDNFYTVHRLTLGSVLKWCAIVALGAALAWYVAFQARFLIIGPSLVLTSDMPTVADTRTVIISGTARNITSLSLNDRPIFTDDDGDFREQLVLENGYTIMTLRARDRYGRDTTLQKEFVYAQAYTSTTPLTH